ncbi:MAG: alanine--tRNA ligase [Cyclobacteriaceae bacterium]|nr:alanine--tRNA ligase [Cyclobacteriaceae bacterium]
MKANQIRQQFLDYFQSKGHQIVPSAPLVIKDDPTLMFTNAGMNQFKDYFLGNKKAEFTRIADTQKCLRVSGKHNDLEEVGLDTYHHTMFEMLGNWSIGDYFKEEAIDWAWELLTEVYGLPKDRLYVTVFGGDKEENLETDNEAFQFWKKHVEESRILYGSKKDNFWEMGDTGPCGPCSEIHIDLRPEKALKEIPGKDLVNEGDPLVIEIWNLVFIQFNRKANGSLELLPQKHVDTGMGFERLAMAIQQKQSNYDTDVFTPIIDEIGRKCGREYGKSEETDIAMRVIADHLRAVSFAIADGQMPSNNGAGYVIRRILRRAVRYGFTYLSFQEPFIHSLCNVLADQFKDVFPELKAQEDFVSRVIREEEASFLRTLENGIRIFEEACLSAKQNNGAERAVISGEIAFRLYDTFGFPLDLTLLLAREKGISVDTEDFNKHMEVQKKRSQAAASKETGDWNIVSEADQITFSGYENLQTYTRILRYRELKDAKKTSYQLVLENTPFYAESGGQVGDSGILMVGSEKIKVLDTHKENDLIVHVVDKLPRMLHEAVQCQVDEDRRKLIEANHSCTHLLHAALRQVLGSHVQQRGSLVSDKILRFDFSHFSKLDQDELAQIEMIVNHRIRENIKLDEKRNVAIEKAKEMGAMALFGEKYGEFVRVITFDPAYSVELCGGTHVKATGQIGYFKILTESSVAAGVRRIEALTSVAAVNYVDQQLELLNSIREVLKNPKDPVKAVESILSEKSQLLKQVEKYQLEQTKSIKENLKNKVQLSGKYSVIADVVEMPTADALKKLAFELKNEISNLYLVLAASIDEKPQIAVMFSENLVEEDGLDANQIVRELAPEIQGGGGGQKFFATAGGKDVKGLPRVIEKIKSKLAL